ncbi:D-apionate lactonase [Rhizobium grahamii]|uniref:Uncharacterized protein n=1 Tax=Rhizobium grahamii CCGE 502 TaxID=990285 RepID=S3I5E3_9HYPH|nr:hypothetical protein [Rhizobium grahamii]EPE94763.1 hypothetical protein RGCCGE502_29683 [Rhizobium grahamii CCGE 502]
MTTDVFKLYGTSEVEAEPNLLRAGKLEVDLANGNLRNIRYDGVEVLRAISYIVRDRDWGTYSPHISDLTIDEDGSRFDIFYRAEVAGPAGTDLVIDVRIAGTSSGVDFNAVATSRNGFETNRCGFCILHPIVGVAGASAVVEHVDGTVVSTQFPDLIDPWQPFKEMRAITHTAMQGVTAECRMEGDTFEMEDQRNWSDASYKTYVRPLALPWPYQIASGEIVCQKISLIMNDRRTVLPGVARRGSNAIKLEPGARSGTMPRIGLIITPEEAEATLRSKAILAEIGPQDLVFHFDPEVGHDEPALRNFAKIANAHPGRSTLEIALACQRSPSTETAEIARQIDASGFAPDAIMISPSVDRQSTPPGSKWPECPPLEEVYAAAHAAFPGIQIGGGMLSYFTELNRKRVPASQLCFISHCTNPIVHAADDLSVIQTLEALPFITRSVRAIYGDLPYRIGPSTIPMRQNPYGSRTMENPSGRRIAMANRDPRHNGQFAEAFAFGYAARILDANLDSLALSALTGNFGLIAEQGEPAAEGTLRPLANTVKLLSGLAGSIWRECHSPVSKILAFVAQTTEGPVLFVVNLAREASVVDLSSFELARDNPESVFSISPFAIASHALA